MQYDDFVNYLSLLLLVQGLRGRICWKLEVPRYDRSAHVIGPTTSIVGLVGDTWIVVSRSGGESGR